MLLSDSQALEKKSRFIDRMLTLEMHENLAFSKELFDEWRIQDLEILEEKRVQIKELIFSFLMYYRDMLICKTGGDKLPIYYANRRDVIISKSMSLPEDVLFQIIQVIKTSLEYLDDNANISLLLENMITKILHLQSGRRTNVW